MKKIFLGVAAILAFATSVQAQKYAVRHYTKHRMVRTGQRPLKKLITTNVGKDALEAGIFKNPEFNARFRRILGTQYSSVVKNFNTVTPIVNEGDIYKFTGCQAHNCGNNHTAVFYDATKDAMMVQLERNGNKQTFSDKGKIMVSDALMQK